MSLEAFQMKGGLGSGIGVVAACVVAIIALGCITNSTKPSDPSIIADQTPTVFATAVPPLTLTPTEIAIAVAATPKQTPPATIIPTSVPTNTPTAIAIAHVETPVVTVPPTPVWTPSPLPCVPRWASAPLTPSKPWLIESDGWAFRIENLQRSDDYVTTFPPITIQPTEGHQILRAIVVVGNTSNEQKEGLFLLRVLWQGQVLKIYQVEPRGGPDLFPTGDTVAKEGIVRETICVEAGYEEERFVMVEIPREAVLEDVIFEIAVTDDPRVVSLSTKGGEVTLTQGTAIIPPTRLPGESPIAGDKVSLAEAQARLPYIFTLPADTITTASISEVWVSSADMPGELQRVWLIYSNDLEISIEGWPESPIYYVESPFQLVTVRGVTGRGKDPGVARGKGSREQKYPGSVSWWTNRVQITIYHPDFSLAQLIRIAESMPELVWKPQGG
jgi:hypothetical protein